MLIWPTLADQRLLLGLILFAWSAVAYAIPSGPFGRSALALRADQGRRVPWRRSVLRAVALAGATLALARPIERAWILALVLATLAVALPILRVEAALRRRLAAAWEVAANLAAFVIAGFGVSALALHPRPLGIELPASAPAVGYGAAVLAIALFVKDGGTHFVRALLDRFDLVPLDEHRIVDESEYNHGRTIGELERLLLLIFVLAGSYTAVGVLVAAKGLIRVGAREDAGGVKAARRFSEYVVIGTLASMLLVILAALTIRLGFGR